MERVILTTGGTGGHIFPALAVAEEIRKRYPHAMILFMGGMQGQEADIAVNAGLDFVGLPVKGVMGRGFKGVGAAFCMARGVVKALAVIRKTKPELVIGFGGYAAFAGVLAGRLSGRLTAIHEQNSFPGMSNRLLGKIVDRVYLSMPDSAGVFNPGKTLLVGNPVRAGIAELHEQRLARMDNAAEEASPKGKSYFGGVDAPSPFAAEKKPDESRPELPAETAAASSERPHGPRLLVMGGSQGARAINEGMLHVLQPLLEAGIEIWHQTGTPDYERLRAAYRDAGAENVRVEPFITDMAKAYAWADLVFCRAGASSLAEITAVGLPAVLTPFPFATQDHQRHNARFLESRGAAVILEQDIFYGSTGDPQALAELLRTLLWDKDKLGEMALRSLALGRPYGAAELVEDLETLLAARKI